MVGSAALNLSRCTDLLYVLLGMDPYAGGRGLGQTEAAEHVFGRNFGFAYKRTMTICRVCHDLLGALRRVSHIVRPTGAFDTTSLPGIYSASVIDSKMLFYPKRLNMAMPSRLRRLITCCCLILPALTRGHYSPAEVSDPTTNGTLCFIVKPGPRLPFLESLRLTLNKLVVSGAV